MVILDELVVSRCFTYVSMLPTPLNMPLSTSEKHPIHVDFIPVEALNLPGQLGLTIAPGKQNWGMQFLWQRNLALDLDRLRQHYQIDLLVSLIEESELSQLNIPHLFTEVSQRGMCSLWFPIPDFRAPASIPATMNLVGEILRAVEQGKTVVTHCKGGLGRSGLIIASCLTTLGYTAEEAFAIVRKARPGSVETQEQEAFVQQFAQSWQLGDRAS
jgi:protein-tyrosine phosphatase